MAFLLDSNTFIQAKNFFYRFSFCPGFWEWLSIEHAKGTLFSIEMIRNELLEGNDELAKWVKKGVNRTFFVRATPAVVASQAVVAKWVNAQPGYSIASKSSFLAKADPWLIAEAIVGGHQIVTFEPLVAANSTKVKIPNVASNFGVNIASIYDVIEQSGAILRL